MRVEIGRSPRATHKIVLSLIVRSLKYGSANIALLIIKNELQANMVYNQCSLRSAIRLLDLSVIKVCKSIFYSAVTPGNLFFTKVLVSPLAILGISRTFG